MFSVNFKKNTVSRQAAIILLIALISVPAFSFNLEMQMNGESFSNACTQPDESWISFCNGYIQAVVDGIREADNICLPSGSTRTDLVTVAGKEITASNQLRKMNAYDAVRTVLSRHYPC